MKNLSEKALIVNFTVSLWSASKTDKKITREVEQAHNATNAGRFNKILVAKTALEDVKRISSSARTFHYENTLPWGDNGDRLLPSANYFEYINKQREFKFQFETAVEKFIYSYPHIKEEAKSRLNGMFNEADYPTLQKLPKKFSMETTFMPIANLDDFRISVNQTEIERLRNDIEQNIYLRINDATKHIWQRIADAIRHMYERLSDKEAVFRDTLVTNISDLINLLPRLNFTDNQEINEVIEEMKGLIVSPDYLRASDNKRMETAENAKELLGKITDFLGSEYAFAASTADL